MVLIESFRVIEEGLKDYDAQFNVLCAFTANVYNIKYWTVNIMYEIQKCCKILRKQYYLINLEVPN